MPSWGRKGSPVTAIIAATALAVGVLSAAGGILQERTADARVCATVKHTNAQIRGLVDDFTVKNPQVTAAQLAQVRVLTLARFPDHC